MPMKDGNETKGNEKKGVMMMEVGKEVRETQLNSFPVTCLY